MSHLIRARGAQVSRAARGEFGIVSAQQLSLIWT